MTARQVMLIILSISSCSAFSQGTFQDLNFEAANVSGFTPNFPIPTTSAFPGWQAFYGTTPISDVSFDGISIGSAQISIINNYPPFGLVPLQGNYSAELFSTSVPVNMTTTLTQTGLVPAGTQSIQMDIEENSGSFTVALNGTTINMVPWQTLPNYTVYAGNVSAWSGQTANLSITENLPSNPVVYPDWMLLDDIAFSPTSVVPDPDPLVLMGIGGALFAAYRRLMENRK